MAESGAENGYVLEHQVGFVLRKVHQRATEVFNEVMAEFGVTPMQFSAMIKLQDVGETSQNRLGRMVAMDPATTKGVVNRLKTRGYVRQRVDPGDGRQVLLSLTDAGAAAADAARARASAVSQGVLAPLSGGEAARLLALLERLE